MPRYLLLLAPLGLSIVLAAMLQASLSRTVRVEPTPTPVLVVLTIADRRITCPTSRDLVAADELELTPEEAPAVIARVCLEDP